MLKLFFVLWCLIGIVPMTHAQDWQAAQGDIVRLETDAPQGVVNIRAFDIDWPVKRLSDSRIVAWVGVGIKTKPATYPIVMSLDLADGRHFLRTDQLVVAKGNFRISRITVKKKHANFNPKSLARIRSDQRALGRTYNMPVDANPDVQIDFMPVEGPITTPLGAQRYINGQPRSPHTGVDIAAPEGTPAKTPLAGKVLLTESMFLTGNSVVIGHGNGLYSVFVHLSEILVKEGQWLATGEVFAKVGQTGRATGPHLHWSLRFHKKRVDPLSLLRK
ncbi:MAG: M23 family metallopeptidase [Mariprofundaceae bacterium]|nr:M23 family metallopeptidase [Mariprofundaceae bacterium]